MSLVPVPRKLTIRERIEAVYREYYTAIQAVRAQELADPERSKQEVELWSLTEEKLAAVLQSQGRALH